MSGVMHDAQSATRIDLVSLIVEAIEDEAENRRVADDTLMPADVRERAGHTANDARVVMRKGAEGLEASGWHVDAISELLEAARAYAGLAAEERQAVHAVHLRFAERRHAAAERLAAARQLRPEVGS